MANRNRDSWKKKNQLRELVAELTGMSGAATYDALSSFADADGVCYPSPQAISKRCGACEKTVRTAIKTLIDAGFVKLIEAGGGRFNTNKYQLVTLENLVMNTDFQKRESRRGRRRNPVNITEKDEKNPVIFSENPVKTSQNPVIFSENPVKITDEHNQERNQERNQEEDSSSASPPDAATESLSRDDSPPARESTPPDEPVGTEATKKPATRKPKEKPTTNKRITPYSWKTGEPTPDCCKNAWQRRIWPVFCGFWRRYPKKRDWLMAWKAFVSLIPEGDFEEMRAIFKGVSEWERSENWRDGYILDPVRFLARYRYRDPENVVLPAKDRKSKPKPREETPEEETERRRRNAEARAKAHEEYQRIFGDKKGVAGRIGGNGFNPMPSKASADEVRSDLFGDPMEPPTRKSKERQLEELKLWRAEKGE